MITNAILNFVFGFFDIIFSKLPIPDTPQFVDSALTFVAYWVGKGAGLVSWLIPQNLWVTTIEIVGSLMVVRVSYDLYRKFHTLRKAPV